MADLPEDRLRLARLWRNGAPQLSSLAGCAHSARNKKVPCCRSPRCSGPSDAPPVVSGLTMAIEVRMVAARYNQETGQ
ncbi:hypothetical protein [Acetobacter persici]|uniref:Uncharacterized protein n=1 Tax=Acetobacter persici TaxID=1076596 RepID=A0A1U9LH19_9PROT|nr:hypothetical protein [Acetobacter persici]AQT05753.1 hypothetical protein A0U91_13990 [Acetobacter persici]